MAENQIGGSKWPGFDKIKTLVIFGDSYSSLKDSTKIVPKPDPANRLGVEWPGYTWNEPDKPNWVGHLLGKQGTNTSMLVYDYAIGGHTVADMRLQVHSNFTQQLGSALGELWNENESLFVTWIGINDCAGFNVDIQSRQDALFSLQSFLYDKGARNFLFIDLPPINRRPGGTGNGQIYKNWNSRLKEHITQFSSDHEDVTAMLFSSHDLFNRLLDNPAQYGFDAAKAHKRRGSIWHDHLHPTSQVHDMIATELAQYLATQRPIVSDPNDTTTLS